MALDIGRRIGRYEILAMIGAGGMGEVYRALDSRLNRAVALKVLPAGLSGDQTQRERFLREARAISSLSHPHICTLYDAGSADDLDYLVMEYLEGQTLAARLSHGPVPLHEAIKYAVQIADALDQAHRMGIVHRDLKPGNVMLTKSGAKLLDFGLAKPIAGLASAAGRRDSARSTGDGPLTGAGVVVGTLPYMSPEQLQGKEIDTATDMFAFGAVLYEMLTGRQAFDGSSDADVIAAVLTRTPPPMSGIRADIPAALDGVVARCLAHDPDDRWQTFRDLLSVLKWIAGGGDRTAAVAATVHASHRKPGRNRRRMAAALVLLVLPVVSIWWGTRTVTPDSLAILPLQEPSGDPALAYLSDGITESLIRLVSPLPGVRVMSSASVFQYRGQAIDPVVIARELDVDAVLIGRIRLQRDILSIGVELIDGRDGRLIWGNQYNRPFADLQTTQVAISREIAGQLRTTLGGEMAAQLVSGSSGSAEAYDLYLQGRYYWNKRTPPDMLRALDFFRRAIDRDSDYALAHVGLADAYAVLGSIGYDAITPAEAIRLAEPHVRRALELDEGLAEAHASLGFLLRYRWARAEADREHRLAVSLNPNYVTGRQWLASHLWALGRFDEALIELERARILDPHSPVVQLNVGRHYYYLRDFRQAVLAFRRALEMDGEYLIAGQLLALAHLLDGNPGEALRQLGATPSRGPFLAVRGYVAASTGDTADALRVLQELEARSQNTYVPAYAFATVYAGLGRKDDAFAYLEQAYQEQSPYLDYLSVEPTLDTLRDDPRFEDLLRRVGLEAVHGRSARADT